MTRVRRENREGQEHGRYASMLVFFPVSPDPAHKPQGDALGRLGAAAPGLSHPCMCFLLEQILHKGGESLCRCAWGNVAIHLKHKCLGSKGAHHVSPRKNHLSVLSHMVPVSN